MTIVAIKTGAGGGSTKIELSDGSSFSFKDCYLPPYAPVVAEGREVSGEEEAGFRFASACLRAEKAALQLIARAEQNSLGLQRKLEKRRHDPACVRAVIARLAETGLLDNRRYARLWLETRIARQATSPWRLLAALRSRGVDRQDAHEALRDLLDDDGELLLLRRYAEKLERKRAKRAARGGAAAGPPSLRYLLKSEGFSSLAIQRFFDE
ncbi:MAG: RecX family transcriptional regulator [Treponema sp.]|nr:RecX family transcriptional regulator [Treponema sp.]